MSPRSRKKKAKKGPKEGFKDPQLAVISDNKAEQLTGIVESIDHSISQSGALCARCARIDFDKLFIKRQNTDTGDATTALGTIATWNIEACIFCRLLASLIDPGAKVDGSLPLFLSAYPTKHFWRKGFSTIDTFVLVLSGVFACLVLQPSNQEVIRRLHSGSIDYGVLQEWIKYCQDHHTKACVLEETVPVKYLKVVDCRTRKVVLANRQPYVTLSYVWGDDLSDLAYHDTLPSELPMTIEDSFKVVIALGYQYIWIDRYCIDQSKPEEVQHQVGMMDLIYRNSDLTIIAATGENPTYGLPGVSKRARQTQHAEQINGRVLISTMDDTATLIKKSKWNSRGWTY